MATVVKDFKVKNGLIVEGTTGTINNHDILTKKTDDQNYIVNLIGGTATSANEANKVVKRDGSGNFAAGTVTANLTGNVTGNASTATTLETSRKIELVGDVTGEVMFNGSHLRLTQHKQQQFLQQHQMLLQRLTLLKMLLRHIQMLVKLLLQQHINHMLIQQSQMQRLMLMKRLQIL